LQHEVRPGSDEKQAIGELRGEHNRVGAGVEDRILIDNDRVRDRDGA
jgi:hypothetical protein